MIPAARVAGSTAAGASRRLGPLADGGPTVAPDDDRDAHRRRGEPDGCQPVVPTGEATRRTRPQLAHDVHPLVGDLPPAGEVGAERLELLPHPPDTDTEHEASRRQCVDAGEHLGHRHRVAEREHQDADADADPAGPAGHEGEQGDRFEQGLVRVEGGGLGVTVRIRRRDGAGDDSVVANPQPVVAEVLGRLDHRADLVGVGGRAPRRDEDAQFHRELFALPPCLAGTKLDCPETACSGIISTSTRHPIPVM